MDNNRVFDYTIIKKLGEGSFGEVVLAKKNGEQFAIKQISKKQIIKVNKLHEPFIEKEILFKLNTSCAKQPLFVKIYDTESDDDRVYLMLEYCSGGTLENLIFSQCLNMSAIKHVSAKILLALEKLHSLGVVHRDLKPSNFLLTHDHFLKLSDFGTAYAPDSFYAPEVADKIKSIKEMNGSKEKKDIKALQIAQNTEQRRSTFVGTACYMAPELLSDDICGKQADIWGFGCILYEMIFKRSPFFDQSQGMVWKKILNQDIDYFTEEYTGKEDMQLAVDLLRKILVKDVSKRLGKGPDGYKQLHNHLFFRFIDWQNEAYTPLNINTGLISQNEAKAAMMKKADKVLLSGVVNKKMFFGNLKERNLILYSTPKLVYYDTESGDKKGQIILQKGTPVAIEGKYFLITNQKKTYYFKSKNTVEWAEMIQSSIINAYY